MSCRCCRSRAQVGASDQSRLQQLVPMRDVGRYQAESGTLPELKDQHLLVVELAVPLSPEYLEIVCASFSTVALLWFS